MFNDIISGSIIINENAVNDALQDLNKILNEADIFTFKPNVLTEAATEEQKKSIIKRFVDAFKLFIAKIADWFKKILNLANKRTETVMEDLKKETPDEIREITIAAPANIKKADEIFSTVLSPAVRQLISFNMTEYIAKCRTKDADVKKTIKEELVGYVPLLSKYNSMKATEIIKELFGEKIIQRGVDPVALSKTIEKVSGINMVFGKFTMIYELALQKTSEDVTNADLAPIMSFIHGYYSRNVSLLTTLMAQTVDICTKALTQINVKANTSKEANK